MEATLELSPRREQGRGLGLQGPPRGQGCQGPAGLTTEDATHQQVDAACDGQAGCAQDGGEQEAGRYNSYRIIGAFYFFLPHVVNYYTF